MKNKKDYYINLFEEKGYILYATTIENNHTILNFRLQDTNLPCVLLDIDITGNRYRFMYPVKYKFLLSSDYISNIDDQTKLNSIENEFIEECAKLYINKEN